MPAEKKFRAIIWDMGGVLLRNMDPSVRGGLGKPYGLSYMDLENLFFGNPVAKLATIGQANESDIWEYVRQRLNLRPEELPEFARIYWSCDQLDEELYTFIMGLKPAYKIGLLSNAYRQTPQALEQKFPHIFNLFDAMVISAEVGLAKPDPRIYQLMLERLDVRAEEAIFVDDFIENIAAAQAYGLAAVHFRNAQQARIDVLALLAE